MTSPVTASHLAQLPNVTHGFFTREGGVSQGIYLGLNCGVGSDDDAGDVTENRRRVATAMGVSADRLATPYQIHSPDAVFTEIAWTSDNRPKADAVVTDRPGLAIAVGTADCGPVLFADGEAGVVGAAHAGWGGAVGGVLAATVDAMEARGARRERIVAVLGPTISQANYEVGPERVADIVDADSDNDRWFTPSGREGHALFDLPGYIVARLGSLGLAHASSLDLCTYADADRFFSFRRTTHRGEPDYGRQLSAIALTAEAP